MNAPFTIYAVVMKPGEDPTKIGVDFKKRNGFLFKGKKSLYGKMFLTGPNGEEVQYKIMVLKNDFFKEDEDNPKYDDEERPKKSEDFDF